METVVKKPESRSRQKLSPISFISSDSTLQQHVIITCHNLQGDPTEIPNSGEKLQGTDSVGRGKGGSSQGAAAGAQIPKPREQRLWQLLE